MSAAIREAWEARVVAIELLCKRVYESTAPEYRDRLLLIDDPRAPVEQLPVVACWTFREVAQCVSGLWPDCGSIPCGFPCAGGRILRDEANG